MKKHFTTKKGTELPILDLRGKDYLEVKFRLVWFREEKPDWGIETHIVSQSNTGACVQATIKDEKGRTVATSHKAETAAHFPDFMEKAETGAIGRALALIGYGTQFCADELDEGERLADSPVQKIFHKKDEAGMFDHKAEQKNAAPGEYVIPFGKKYKDLKIKQVARAELEGYIDWLKRESAKKGKPIDSAVIELENAKNAYYATIDPPFENDISLSPVEHP